MAKQALNVAVMPRARRNRFVLAALAGLSLTATATLAGAMLVTSGGGPVLTTVSGYALDSGFDNPSSALPAEVVPFEHAALPAAHAESTSDAQTEAANEMQSEDDPDLRWFNGRPIRPAGTMSMLVTAYSPDEQSCGEWADGITASGYSVWTNGMNLVASDNSILPLGSLVSVPGYDNGDVVPVLDRGGAIKGNRLDVLYPTHERALQWGVQRLEVTIWEYADGKPNGFRQNHRR